MGAAKKNRRRIMVDNRLYLWSVSGTLNTNDLSSAVDKNTASLVYALLHVVSHDKRLIVDYDLCQSQATHDPYLTVISPSFPGLSDKTKRPLYLRTPHWVDDTRVSPAFIRRLIEWCLDETKTIIEVDKYGAAAVHE